MISLGWLERLAVTRAVASAPRLMTVDGVCTRHPNVQLTCRTNTRSRFVIPPVFSRHSDVKTVLIHPPLVFSRNIKTAICFAIIGTNGRHALHRRLKAGRLTTCARIKMVAEPFDVHVQR
ncbi:hypothetical protein C0Q70_12140 [Pomacea canaliculata]|uniref:Uncharacterized protein n=1 Tax=Pomacea canaliculata TaxID=400727 RepID=A0A2T7P0P5_POMCA|nr:hypothetical protein C0Q70_12140 [Pomacea canaliculata]